MMIVKPITKKMKWYFREDILILYVFKTLQQEFEVDSVFAITLLPLMIPDARTKSNPDKVIYLTEVIRCII